MHTVDLLALAVQVAKQAGYQIRQDWFGGSGGGGCEFGGQKWIFLDLALNPRERLDQIQGVLGTDPSLAGLVLPAPLAQLWNYPKAA
ncbi:MAG: hypothetical protein VB862_00745 [Pirellulaceae bacterium]|jgi:hypothetical protein